MGRRRPPIDLDLDHIDDPPPLDDDAVRLLEAVRNGYRPRGESPWFERPLSWLPRCPAGHAMWEPDPGCSSGPRCLVCRVYAEMPEWDETLWVRAAGDGIAAMDRAG